jgi:hypothetical protein
MVDLKNNMSVVVSEIIHAFWPKKFVQFCVMLVPTPGSTAPDPDTIEKYGVAYTIFFSHSTPSERALCLALLGKSVADIRQWVLAEWQKYKTDPATAEGQLRTVFEYVASVGLKV